MTDLKPCPNPWCKPTMPPITISVDGPRKMPMLAKLCFECGVQSPAAATLEEADDRWNQRSADPHCEALARIASGNDGKPAYSAEDAQDIACAALAAYRSAETA